MMYIQKWCSLVSIWASARHTAIASYECTGLEKEREKEKELQFNQLIDSILIADHCILQLKTSIQRFMDHYALCKSVAVVGYAFVAHIHTANTRAHTHILPCNRFNTHIHGISSINLCTQHIDCIHRALIFVRPIDGIEANQIPI